MHKQKKYLENKPLTDAIRNYDDALKMTDSSLNAQSPQIGPNF